MAAVDLLTSAGVSSTAMPFKIRNVALITSAGTASATAQVPWAGTNSPLSRVPWIPKAGTPLLMQGTNQLNPAWDRAIRWLFEEYIGGLSAPTIAQVTQSVSETQSAVTSAVTFAEQGVAYSAGIAASVVANTEVAQTAGLPGADSIPDVPERPTSGRYVL